MKVDVLNIKGEKTGRSVELPDGVFNREVNEHAIYLVVKQQQANKRQGTHDSKERNAVMGSTRKIKRQKGTGTARAGDIKNPIFRGGGRVFGPHPRTYSLKVNKKVKRLAKFSVLSQKANSGQISVVEDFTFDQPKTREYAGLLANLEANNSKSMLVLTERDDNLYLSSRNLKRASVTLVNELNVYDLMNTDRLILSESSVKQLTEMYA